MISSFRHDSLFWKPVASPEDVTEGFGEHENPGEVEVFQGLGEKRADYFVTSLRDTMQSCLADHFVIEINQGRKLTQGGGIVL